MDKKIEELVIKAVRDLDALPEEEMRLNLLCERLLSLTDEEAAAFVGLVYSLGPGSPSFNRARSLFIDQRALRKNLGDKFTAIREASIRLGLKMVAGIFSELKPHKKGLAGYVTEEEGPMELVSLGARRSMSKSWDRKVLDKLLSDPDPMVVDNLLNNPKITERDILKMASKRPNSPEILRIISVHRAWSKRYLVRKAIALNPYAAPAVSIALLDFLMATDLKLIAGDKTLHPEVKTAAGELIKKRGTGGI